MRLQQPLQYFLSLFVLSLLLSACTLPLPPHVDVGAAKRVSIHDFTEQLSTAFVQQDYGQLQGLMGSDFVLAGWRAEGRALPAAVAIIQLRNHYLSAGSAVVIPNKVDWAALLDGSDPLTMWGPQVQAVKAIYATGLGTDQQDEAVLIIAQQPDGAPYWHSMLVAPGGFQAEVSSAAKRVMTVANTETTAVETIPVLEEASTDPRYIVFDPGTTTAAKRGVLQAQEQKEYLVRALEGQLLAVEIASPTGQATFTIGGVDEQLRKGIGKGTKFWQGNVPATQDYLITVTAPAVTPYELVASFDPRQAPTIPEPAPIRLVFAAGATTVTTTARVAAPERQRYLVRGVAGQNLQIVLTSTTGAAIFAIQGIADGKPLKRLESAVNTWSSTLPATQDYLITVTPTSATVEYTLALAVQ